VLKTVKVATMKDRDNPAGLRYLAIADEIRRRVISGQYTFGRALPSQAALAGEFDTTVMTVRQALKVLEAEGLIELRHGVGSFVSGLREDHRDFTLSGFRRALGPQAKAVRTEVVFRRQSTTNESAFRALETGGRGSDGDSGRGGGVSAIGRRRILGSTVLVYQISYVSEEYWEVLRRYEPGNSLYTSLNTFLDTVITRADERIGAIGTPRTVAAEMAIPPGSPCLFSERVSKDAGGKAVLFDQAYMRSDGVELLLHRYGTQAYPSYVIHDGEDL
jgi:GntR family transcriptional regulator